MSNDTQRSNAKGLFVTSGDYNSDQTVAGSILQLSRVQDLSWQINYALQDESYLDYGSESINNRPSSIDVNFGWLQTNGGNETALGLITDGINSVFTGLNIEKNFYVSIENRPGYDAIGSTGIGLSKTVIAMGQAVMNGYSMSARVGGMLESNTSFNCLTAYIYTGESGNRIPAVNYLDGTQLNGLFTLPDASSQYSSGFAGLLAGTFSALTISGLVTGTFTTPSALGPFTLSFTGNSGLLSGTFTGQTSFDPNSNGVSALTQKDISLDFLSGSPFGLYLSGDQSCHLQSFTFGFSVNREEVKSLGYAYPTSRHTLFPIVVDFSATAIVSKYQSDQLQRINCLTTGHAIRLNVKYPCTDTNVITLYMKGLQLESQGVSSTLSASDNVNLKWRGVINNPYDLRKNVTFGIG